MRPLFRAAFLLVLAACASTAPNSGATGVLPTSVGVPRLTPRQVGGILLTGVELPAAGTVFGGHYQGSGFSVRQFTYQLTEVARIRWSLAARARGESLLRGTGYRVESVGAPSSDPQRLQNVRFGLSGLVTELEVRTSGPSEPYRVESDLEVAWEVLDLGSGGVIFGRSVRGTARITGPIDSAVGVAMDRALERLLADSLFLRTLGTPSTSFEGASRNWTRPPPGERDTIVVALSDLNTSPDSGAVERIAFGLVSLHGAGGAYYGTASILTADGLAVTTNSAARAARRGRGVRARLASGVERPVRLLRARGGLNVALLEVQCPDLCPTIDWRAPAAERVDLPVVIMGNTGDGVSVNTGRLGGRWGLANGVTLRPPENAPGDVVATTSGKVFAMVAPRRSSALMLDEILRALRVQVGPGLR